MSCKTKSFSGGRSWSTRRESPTMGKHLVNFITCGCESSAPFLAHLAKGHVSFCHHYQIKKFYLKSVHFITVQHKLSRAFQTDMHNKIT
jgi:hypothetical protein